MVVDTSGFNVKNEQELLLKKSEFELLNYDKFNDYSKIRNSKKSLSHWVYRLDKFPTPISSALGVISEKNYHIQRSVSPIKYAIDDFQGLKFFPDPKIILEFFDSLRFRPNWLSENIRIAKITRPVFIHIRLTDYLNYPEIYPIPKAEYYINALAHLRELVHFNEVWLFSDDPKGALEHLGGKIDNLKIAVTPQNARPSEVLEMMSHGAGLVIGNSTFSWWGTYLSRLRSQEIGIVRPKRFTNLDNDPADNLIIDKAFKANLDGL